MGTFGQCHCHRAIFVGEIDDVLPLSFGPDLPAMRPWDRRGHVWIELEGGDEEDEFASVTGDAQMWSVSLRRDHWLPRWASATGRHDREAIAWLLLACYARVNEVFAEVTNHHEGQMQQAVADALATGRLALVVPRRE